MTLNNRTETPDVLIGYPSCEKSNTVPTDSSPVNKKTRSFAPKTPNHANRKLKKSEIDFAGAIESSNFHSIKVDRFTNADLNPKFYINKSVKNSRPYSAVRSM